VEKSLCYFRLASLPTPWTACDLTAVITGYNTDVEYDGVVYHVQTEDKGINTPVILSLVYLDGAILASKRTPYDDLVLSGFDQAILATRLHRQHKLICAAVHAGRIEELKRLSGRDADRRAAERGKRAREEDREPEPADIREPESPDQESAQKTTTVAKDRFSISEAREEEAEKEAFKVWLLEEPELRAGDSVALRVLVTRCIGDDRYSVAKARVTLKVLGSSFRPESTMATSDKDGVALIFAQLPRFTGGRAAILVRAEANGETAELRRIILPA